MVVLLQVAIIFRPPDVLEACPVSAIGSAGNAVFGRGWRLISQAALLDRIAALLAKFALWDNFGISHMAFSAFAVHSKYRNVKIFAACSWSEAEGRSFEVQVLHDLTSKAAWIRKFYACDGRWGSPSIFWHCQNGRAGVIIWGREPWVP